MRTDRLRRGQAAYEFAVGVAAFALAFTALVEFAPVLTANLRMQSDARVDAGVAALGAAEGSAAVGGGSAAAIAARAHPDPGTAGVDPWGYPIRNLPSETRFGEWQSDSLLPVRLIEGSVHKDYTFSLFFDGVPLLDRERGSLAEEVHMPALGGVRAAGGLE